MEQRFKLELNETQVLMLIDAFETMEEDKDSWGNEVLEKDASNLMKTLYNSIGHLDIDTIAERIQCINTNIEWH